MQNDEHEIDDKLLARVYGEYLEMPGLQLTLAQASRLWNTKLTISADVLNRLVDQVPSVASDNIRAVKRAVEHLAQNGHRRLSYLAGPEASWADGMRWRGVLEAGHELDISVRRIGPHPPTPAGGRQAAEAWLRHPTTGVIA